MMSRASLLIILLSAASIHSIVTKTGLATCQTAVGDEIILDLTSPDFNQNLAMSEMIDCLNSPVTYGVSTVVALELSSTTYVSVQKILPQALLQPCSQTNMMFAFIMFARAKDVSNGVGDAPQPALCLNPASLGLSAINDLLQCIFSDTLTCLQGTYSVLAYLPEAYTTNPPVLTSVSSQSGLAIGPPVDPFTWTNATQITSFIEYVLDCDGFDDCNSVDTFLQDVSLYFPPTYYGMSGLSSVVLLHQFYFGYSVEAFDYINGFSMPSPSLTLPGEKFFIATMFPGADLGGGNTVLDQNIICVPTPPPTTASSRRRRSALTSALSVAFPGVGLILMNHAVEKALRHITAALNQLAATVQSSLATIDFFLQYLNYVALTKPLLLSFFDNLELISDFSTLALTDSNLLYSVASTWLPNQIVRVNTSFYQVVTPPPIIVLKPVTVCPVYGNDTVQHLSLPTETAIFACDTDGTLALGCVTGTCSSGDLTVNNQCDEYSTDVINTAAITSLISDSNIVSQFHAQMLSSINDILTNNTDGYQGLSGNLDGLGKALDSVADDLDGVLGMFGKGSFSIFGHVITYLIFIGIAIFAIWGIMFLCKSARVKPVSPDYVPPPAAV